MEDKHLELKHRLAFGATIAAFFCSTLLVFGPLSLYVGGNDEMWFSFRSLLLPVTLVALGGFILLAATLSLPKGIIHKLLCCLCFGVGLGLYIQCGYFNISYGSGVLDGSQIAWKDYTTYGAIDSAMWAACLALPFAVYMVFKRSWRHILMIAAAFIILLQAGGLAVSLYQNQNTLDKLSHEVTVEGMYDLSEKDNTLVFIMGNMDADYYASYKKEHPETEEKLSGFTEYDNALAAGSDTLVSLPYMLTGSVYKKDIRYTEFTVRDSIRRIVAFCRKNMPYGRDAYLYDIAPQLGSRCSLRLDGEHMFSKLDIATGAKFDDVIAWHSLVGMVNGGAPVEIPYGCILPKKIENLLAPGRHLSATADAVAGITLIPQCVGTGQAAGVAAAVCVKDGTTTHNVDIKKVQKILCTEQDVPLPRQENTDPELVRELEEYKYGTYTEAAKKIRAAAGLDW